MPSCAEVCHARRAKCFERVGWIGYDRFDFTGVEMGRPGESARTYHVPAAGRDGSGNISVELRVLADGRLALPIYTSEQ